MYSPITSGGKAVSLFEVADEVADVGQANPSTDLFDAEERGF
jgi:hypothetical protein